MSDLQNLRARVIAGRDETKPSLVVCAGTACQASDSSRIIRSVKRYILLRDLVDDIRLRVTGCQGFCEMGPFILTEP